MLARVLPRPLIALVATMAATAGAINVTVPSKISAGVETEITIGFDFWKQPFVYETLSSSGSVFDETTAVCRNPVDPEVGCGHDRLYEHYQLYLYTDEWMFTCYLSDLIPVGTTNPRITIPKDLGPSEKYKITAMEFNGTKPVTNYYGVENSNSFTLVDTDITEWTQWEHYGGWLKPWQALPCSSYGCYRTCGLKFADEHGNKKQGTAAGLYDCLNECPGIRADWNDQFSPWDWYKAFDGHDWSGASTAVTTNTPSAISTSGWGYQTADTPETTLYGTPTAQPTYSWYTAITAKPTSTRQSSAARRTAKPAPVNVSSGLLMTVVICLVAFGIGTLIGWIWPDGLRSDW